MPPTKRKQWEYRLLPAVEVTLDGRWRKDVEIHLSGLEGWELVAVNDDIYYMKREKLDASDHD